MYQVIITHHFKRQLKPLLKKFPSLLDNAINLLEVFDEKSATDLGNDICKLRLRSTDLPKGKSGSFRLIILFAELDNALVPLTIYAKNERENMTKEEIYEHLILVRQEL